MANLASNVWCQEAGGRISDQRQSGIVPIKDRAEDHKTDSNEWNLVKLIELTGMTLENYWINSYLSTLFIFHADNRIMADTDVRD